MRMLCGSTVKDAVAVPYVATNFENNQFTPKGSWVCARPSKLPPFKDKPPPKEDQGNPDYCGQCVSFVSVVCRSLPPRTSQWKKGDPVKDAALAKGTIIATFSAGGGYQGHAAVYVSQSAAGIVVMDQWVAGKQPKAIGLRTIRWNGSGINDGGSYYVVD